MRVAVIGAGVGGLVAAALLARAGLEVTVLEAQAYPGGCAGTFIHRGYRFEAGATLLSGFGPGGIFPWLERVLGLRFPVRPLGEGEVLMEVHLSHGRVVPRPVGRAYEQAVQKALFGPQVEAFWRWQEERAEDLWALAPHLPFPPADPREALGLLRGGLGLLFYRRGGVGVFLDLFAPLTARAPKDPLFRRFLNAQLLIAAQTGADRAYALYGAAALDLPHRGPVLPQGGMGAVAQTLARAVEAHGGRVLYRHRAVGLEVRRGRVRGVWVEPGGRRRGERVFLEADLVLANLTPPDLARLLGQRLDPPKDAWGAFALYAALPQETIPKGPLYRQWAGEGDWVFLSLSDPEDPSRAPKGERVLSASVHTPLALWQGLSEEEYRALKARWQARVEGVLERLIPGFREAARLVLAATPRTYAFYTGRAGGWVGGYPATTPLRLPSPRTPLPNLLRVGETVFPGQSVPAVALGGVRVAGLVLGRLGLSLPISLGYANG